MQRALEVTPVHYRLGEAPGLTLGTLAQSQGYSGDARKRNQPEWNVTFHSGSFLFVHMP